MGFYKNENIKGDAYYFSDEPEEDELYSHTCKYPDTGMLKSWCKKCGKEATYKFELGKYTPY